MTIWGGYAARQVGSGIREVERRTVSRGDGGSNPPAAVSKLWQFRSPHICLSFGSVRMEENEKIHNAIKEVSKRDCIIMGGF